MKLVRYLLLSTFIVLSSCGNYTTEPPEKTELYTYEIILQNGDTSYVDAHSYHVFNGFFHTNEPTYKFYSDKYANDVVAEYNNPAQVRKI